jgi:hypothetical protein
MTAPAQWRNRIVEHGFESPEQLLANPKNWRIHPAVQQDQLGDMLERVGWVAEVVVNRTSGFVVDGHLRVAMAISAGEVDVPVSYVELSDAEEDLVLASLDPVSALAIADPEVLNRLLDSEAELAALFSDDDRGIVDIPDDTDADEDAAGVGFVEGEYTVICPDCGYEFRVREPEVEGDEATPL